MTPESQLALTREYLAAFFVGALGRTGGGGRDETGERAAPNNIAERSSFARGKHVRRRKLATQIAAGSWEAATGSAG